MIVITLAAGDPAAGSEGSDPNDPPPANVTKVKGTLQGGKTITLQWVNPTDPDFARVEITRTPGQNGDAQTVVYRGRATSSRHGGLAPGREYQFVIRAVDTAGHKAAGVAVVVVGKNQLLLAPPEGATLREAPRLPLVKVKDADYYNLQLWRGKRKVGTWWPRNDALHAPSRWTFDGKSYRFAPGIYSWYLWPGFGPLSKADYGDMLGQSRFKYWGADRWGKPPSSSAARRAPRGPSQRLERSG